MSRNGRAAPALALLGALGLLGGLPAACSDRLPDVVGAASSAASAPPLPGTWVVEDFDLPDASPPISTSAAALAPRDASTEARRAAALRALRGDGEVALLPVEATDPGQTLDLKLRDRLAPPASRAPSVKMGGTKVTGRLPPEVIQRIVRQRFGRFRLCYETGLQSDPELAGTVEMHFTIDGAGAVQNVVERNSTIPDASVRSCVAKAFGGLSFPQPESGTVTVVFPITFSPPAD